MIRGRKYHERWLQTSQERVHPVLLDRWESAPWSFLSHAFCENPYKTPPYLHLGIVLIQSTALGFQVKHERWKLQRVSTILSSKENDFTHSS